MNYEIVSVRKRKTVKIGNPSDAYNLLKIYAKKQQEYFVVLTLNVAKEVVSMHVVSIGTANRAIVHPREVFVRAIKDFASAVIVAHNHPSGDSKPSDEDREVTKTLKDAGEIIGIRLLDHVVFSKSGYYSFKENNEPSI